MGDSMWSHIKVFRKASYIIRKYKVELMLPQDYIPGPPGLTLPSQSMTFISAGDLNSGSSGPQEPRRVQLGVYLLEIRCSVRTQIISC